LQKPWWQTLNSTGWPATGNGVSSLASSNGNTMQALGNLGSVPLICPFRTHAFLSVIPMTTKLATVGPARREAADQPSLDLCVNSVPTRQPGLHIDLRFIGEDIFGTDHPTTCRTYNISSNGRGCVGHNPLQTQNDAVAASKRLSSSKQI